MATRESATKMAWNRSRLARGLCEKCPAKRAPGDATYCQYHREKRRIQTALWYRANLRRGTEKPMNCPRNGCGGLLLKVECDSGAEGRTHDWKCQACSRRWPATGTPEPTVSSQRTIVVKSAKGGGSPDAIRKLGAAIASMPPGELQYAPHRPLRCKGKQGRGQCKKDAEPGRDYCPHHVEPDTTPPSIAARYRPAKEEADSLHESADGLTATTAPRGTSTAATNDTCKGLHAHLKKIEGQLTSLTVRKDALEKKRATLQAALLVLAGADVEAEG